MNFSERLTTLRKKKGFTQQALAELVGVQVLQIRRYESGASQPTLDVIRKMAIALSVTADELIFGKSERGPDEDLRLYFEAATRLDPQEREVLKSLVEGLLLKHNTKYLLTAR